MTRKTFLLFALGSVLLSAQPAALTISSQRLSRIDALLDRYVQENRIPGAVALVLRDGSPVYQKAIGWADKEAGRKMTHDTIFRIASQTKAITSTAILMLVEEGKIGITEPVGNFIPTFKKTTVAGPDGQITPAKRPITIHDLLTHTAGISYGNDPQVAAAYREKGLGPAAGNGWYTADKDEPICVSMERLGTLPFVSQPGEKYVYGYNTDILGCVVEKASGMPLDKFVETRITGPLGMKDTRFFLKPQDKDRLAAVYASDGPMNYKRAVDGSKGQGSYVDGPRKSFAGGAGLTSTAADYARFLECLRRGGEIDGVRLLSPRTVALMRTNQSGTLHSTNGVGFGYGFDVAERPGAKGLAGVGAFGWGGAYGTSYQVDPESHLVVVFMEQLMPNTTDVQTKFLTSVYQALQ
ncbi:MAG: beta-lactamase family protein [Bryobacterales bacterium]|nr:beta-lactamase family protein [Bryobacterales bacterium]